VTPLPTYPSWAQGLEQGTGAIANAILQRRQYELQRQQFQMQQAEAGYQQPHTEQVYQPGRLNAPSMVASENIPTGTPGATGMGPSTGPAGALGVAPVGTPDSMARTTGSYKTVNVPGYYDITKSLPYAQAELNGRLMAAIYGGQYRQQDAQARYGYTDENNVFHPGTDFYTRMGVVGAQGQNQQNNINARGAVQSQRDQYLYGGPGPIDPNTQQPIGAKAESTIVSQAPNRAVRAGIAAQSASDRAAALAARMRNANITEAQRAVDQDTRAIPKAPAFGFLSPADSTAFAGRSAAARAQLMTDRARLDSLTRAPSGLVTTPGSQPLSSGASVAPHVPRSGHEASSLTPATGPLGGSAPTVPLGTRRVLDATTSSYPTASHLPRSPSDPTVPLGQGTATDTERALYDAAVRRIAQNVADPAEQARQFAQAAAIYQQRVSRRTPQR